MALTPEIKAILCRHPRECLLVPPLQWTCRHLELLNIEFQELDADDKRGDAEDQAQGSAGDESKSKPRPWVDLMYLLAGPDDSLVIMTYFQTPFRFGSRVFNLPSPIFTARPECSDEYDYGRRHTKPSTLVIARLSEVGSPNPLPYIAAALIAAAQSQAGSRRAWGYRQRARYSVSAILADYPDIDNITVYKAFITPTFLSKFGFPKRLDEVAWSLAATTPESLIVRHRRIPYAPRSTLRSRLHGAVGRVNLLPPYALPDVVAVELGLVADLGSG